MASLLKFDDINKLNDYLDSEYEKNSVEVDIKKYFGEMGITDKEKQARINMALSLQDMMLAFFVLVKLQREMGLIDKAYQVEYLKQRYRQIIEEETGKEIDEYEQSLIDDRSSDIVDVTNEHLDEEDEEIRELIEEGVIPEDITPEEKDRIKEASWWLSMMRAGSIACDDSNAIWNYQDFAQAIMDGKTMKKWCDMRDKKERKSHLAVGGKVIPITDPFAVGNGYMMFPMDTSFDIGPEEYLNCRCWVEFS